MCLLFRRRRGHADTERVMRACVAVARAFVCVFKRKETALSAVSVVCCAALAYYSVLYLMLFTCFPTLFPPAAAVLLLFTHRHKTLIFVLSSPTFIIISTSER